MTQEKNTLYGVSLSPFVRKVRAALAIKGVDYDLAPVMPGALDPEFLTKSPLSKVPVWEEGDFALPDSSVICAYLERTRPTPSIYPADARAFGQGALLGGVRGHAARRVRRPTLFSASRDSAHLQAAHR